MQWGHDLLSAGEQVVLRRLAIFPGYFTLAAAEIIVSDDQLPEAKVFEHLVGLVRKSMLTVEPRPNAKAYRLLETTRDFAFDLLKSFTEVSRLRRRHAAYVLGHFETGIDALEVMSDADWLDKHGSFLDDVRVALDWAMLEDERVAVALAAASRPLWQHLSLNAEGRERLRAAVALLRPDTPAAVEARLRLSFGELLNTPASARDGQAEISQAIALYRGLGESSRLGLALARQAFALLMLNRNDESEAAIDEAMALLERSGMLRTHAIAHSVKACTQARNGHFTAAYATNETAERLCVLAGAELSAFGVAVNLVEMSVEMGELDRAISKGQSLVDQRRGTPHVYVFGFALYILAAARIRNGDFPEALAAAREAAPIMRDEGMLCGLLDQLALRRALMGNAADGALLSGFANAAYGRASLERSPLDLHAADRLQGLLREELVAEDAARLKREGARLTEDQALQIALCG